MDFLRNIWNEEEGQGLVEYGLILALIALVVIVAVGALGTKVDSLFKDVKNGMTKPAS